MELSTAAVVILSLLATTKTTSGVLYGKANPLIVQAGNPFAMHPLQAPQYMSHARRQACLAPPLSPIPPGCSASIPQRTGLVAMKIGIHPA